MYDIYYKVPLPLCDCNLVTGPGIVGVAYRTYPRKLGKIYCSNRLDYICAAHFALVISTVVTECSN